MQVVKSGKPAVKVAAVILAAVACAIVVWAWVSGGREPVHEIVVAVPVPEAAR